MEICAYQSQSGGCGFPRHGSGGTDNSFHMVRRSQLPLDLPQCDNSESEYLISPEDPEVRKVTTAATQAESPTASFELEKLAYFSNWFRMKRAVAVCLKLKTLLRARAKSTDKTKLPYQPVSVDEIQRAELEILRLVQHETFKDEITALQLLKAGGSDETSNRERRTALKGASSLFRLDPHLDNDGILRVGGRLKRSTLPLNNKHPAILPRHHHISTLVIRHFHERTGHQGRGMTINAIRENGFWIIGCSSAVTHLITKCVDCRKLHSSSQEQKMSDLPEDRTEPAPPFTYCAIDLWKDVGRRELKRYGVLFTCMVSRAVHIETANSLDTASFINALRRFISLRGPIRQLRSDCGTNFVGAERELREAFEEIEHSRVGDFLLKESCDYFVFRKNVPSARHMGGVWERQIRTVRRVLTGLLRQSGLQHDDECLRTLMHEAAATVNSRPLTCENLNDPTSLEPLAPNHLLSMKSSIILPPPGQFHNADMYPRKRWRRVQQLASECWYRWRREYLQSLQTRQKWNRHRRDLKIDDLVLIKDDLPRNRWRLARVNEVSVDDDGHVRKVKLAVGSPNSNAKGKRAQPIAYLERPIQKLVLVLEGSSVC